MIAFALCLPLAFVPTPSASPTAAPLQDQESLQDFLRRARGERNSVLEALRSKVEKAVERIEKLDPRGRAVDRRLAREALRQHGTASTPLLVPFLDGGETPTAAQTRRMDEVASALRDLGVQSVVPSLVEMAKTAARPARVHALILLGSAPDDPELDAFLEDLANTGSKRIRLAAFGSCVLRDSSQLDGLVNKAFGDGDEDLIETLFDKLPAEQGGRIADYVIRGFAKGRGLDDWIDAALARFDELEQPLPKDIVGAIGGVLDDDTRSGKLRGKILQTLATLEPVTEKNHKKRLTKLSKNSDEDVQTPALLCLAILGDSKAKRQLLSEYDDRVDENKDWAPGYDLRGKILLQIRDYSAAARDFAKAIEIDEDRNREPSQETQINLARAYAGANKIRNAHDALRDAVPGKALLALLFVEPIFADLVDHSRYGKIFDSVRPKK